MYSIIKNETKLKVAPRICTQCDTLMFAGYYDAGDYFCSDECLLEHNQESNPDYTMETWEQDCEENDDDCYYTEWELDSDCYDSEGNYYEIENGIARCSHTLNKYEIDED